MSGNPLLVVHGGYGTTPPCPEARYKVGDVVKVRRLKHLRHLPEIAAVAVVVPPGTPAEYAIADAAGRPRPLMVTAPKRVISYVVGFDCDPVPCLLCERDLLPSGEPPTDIRWQDNDETPA